MIYGPQGRISDGWQVSSARQQFGKRVPVRSECVLRSTTITRQSATAIIIINGHKNIRRSYTLSFIIPLSIIDMAQVWGTHSDVLLLRRRIIRTNAYNNKWVPRNVFLILILLFNNSRRRAVSGAIYNLLALPRPPLHDSFQMHSGVAEWKIKRNDERKEKKLEKRKLKNVRARRNELILIINMTLGVRRRPVRSDWGNAERCRNWTNGVVSRTKVCVECVDTDRFARYGTTEVFFFLFFFSFFIPSRTTHCSVVVRRHLPSTGRTVCERGMRVVHPPVRRPPCYSHVLSFRRDAKHACFVETVSSFSAFASQCHSEPCDERASCDMCFKGAAKNA